MARIDYIRRAATTQPRDVLPRFLIHLRQRHKENRLGLVVGAGVSLEAGCPEWSKLVASLSRAVPHIGRVIRAHRKAQLSDPYITEMVFQRFFEARAKKISNRAQERVRYHVNSKWLSLVHKRLYKKVPANFDTVVAKHSYLLALARFVHKSPVIINFNFDDILDEAIVRDASRLKVTLPEIVTSPRAVRRASATTIFHINGILPREPERRRSEKLVFSEDAFADALISPSSVESEQIHAWFSQLTFLTIGHSFKDASLKNILRLAKQRNPANFHYAVLWEHPSKPRSEEEKKDLFTVNDLSPFSHPAIERVFG